MNGWKLVVTYYGLDSHLTGNLRGRELESHGINVRMRIRFGYVSWNLPVFVAGEFREVPTDQRCHAYFWWWNRCSQENQPTCTPLRNGHRAVFFNRATRLRSNKPLHACLRNSQNPRWPGECTSRHAPTPRVWWPTVWYVWRSSGVFQANIWGMRGPWHCLYSARTWLSLQGLQFMHKNHVAHRYRWCCWMIEYFLILFI